MIALLFTYHANYIYCDCSKCDALASQYNPIKRTSLEESPGNVHLSERGCGNGGNPFTPSALSSEDIHKRMNDALEDKHNADIAKMEAERRAELLRSSIAEERALQKDEEIEQLRKLDVEMEKRKLETPKVLGKTSIPRVIFTEESFPLYHHVRNLLTKMKSIQETEDKAIQAQTLVTRLDDITENTRSHDVAVENPAAYRDFLTAGDVDRLVTNVPVNDIGGDFYMSNPARTDISLPGNPDSCGCGGNGPGPMSSGNGPFIANSYGSALGCGGSGGCNSCGCP